jgi:exopolysaccharide biosynthesis protein
VEPRVDASQPRVWRDAPDAVGGAGLLVAGGTAVADWAPEQTVDAFRTDRHPRTVIGVDGERRIWLIAVDGRHPDVSVGMSFAELQRMCVALGLRDALNLDGGGSTTLVVNGQVVNRPSDVTGPRAVSDAIVVRLRRPGE